ncbi:4Fe-4S dicluster domain-containing protein [Clostridium estertheticum]|uniref:4Fe-4S dicluster domain-containing protein n=1 Tax=Clostridium estertheticum TaxID=238834 RepID=UPI001C7D68E3|nr:4Fe-4S dicluster domain-containing protein [Clostridium estertheticum]MBX4269681.1 4Fe-4S dicluster domain-containing protein [Clostridium estertheticum]WLC77893.1 SLBB domain-containing protein [Clostridium estertheticum]
MELLDQIYKAGVVGAGGAGFPTHIKLKCNVEYLLVNAAECEPLIQTDKYIMRHNADEIIKALSFMAPLVGADKVIIAIKGKYEREIQALQSAIKKLDSKVELFYLKSIYPAGDEQVIVYEVTGRVIPPGGIPLNVGAVVSNVATVLSIYDATIGKSVTDKIITVTGEVNNPSLLSVPIGTPVSKCIKAASGLTIKDYCVIMGGPMMGRILTSDEVEKRSITKTDGGIIVLPADHYIKERKSLSVQHIINQTKSACIQCSYCTQMCPRYLLGHPLRPHKIMRAISMSLDHSEEIFKEALICSECGICEMYACPMGISPRQVNIMIKNELRQKGVKFNTTLKIIPDEQRDGRQVPVSRLVQRLNLGKYKDIKFDDEAIEIKANIVTIPLKQHIGKSATAIVAVGDEVNKGQLIGEVNREDMGANIHASISGKVTNVSDCITIESSEVIL